MFDICVLAYDDADMFDNPLLIQNNAGQEGLALGYVRAVYISPGLETKTLCIPLDSNNVTVSTKDDGWFLKEICIFSAYTSEVYAQQNNVQYQVIKDGEVQCDFIMPRVQTVETDSIK